MNTLAVPVITLDGPGGTGKGTVGMRLARRLGWHYLDSGLLYRGLALVAERRNLAMDVPVQLARLARRLDLVFTASAGDEAGEVLLDGEPVRAELRGEACAELASRIAVSPVVRRALLKRQADFRRPPGLVADGRDMGSVVFPDAVLKVYLTAAPEERARRRYKQLASLGVRARLSNLIEMILRRDERDQERTQSPMKPAPGAVVIDTTDRSIDEIFEKVTALWEELRPMAFSVATAPASEGET